MSVGNRHARFLLAPAGRRHVVCSRCQFYTSRYYSQLEDGAPFGTCPHDGSALEPRQPMADRRDAKARAELAELAESATREAKARSVCSREVR